MGPHLLRQERMTAIKEEHPVYARLISMSGAFAENRERAIETIRDQVIPALSQQKGYAGYVALFDADNQRAKAVLLWETRDAADAAHTAMASFREQVISGLGMTLESADLYEAPVVELA
jgi:hypothetical protein